MVEYWPLLMCPVFWVGGYILGRTMHPRNPEHYFQDLLQTVLTAIVEKEGFSFEGRKYIVVEVKT